MIHEKVGYNSKKDLSYSSASTIENSFPLLIRLLLNPFAIPPKNAVKFNLIELQMFCAVLFWQFAKNPGKNNYTKPLQFNFKFEFG